MRRLVLLSLTVTLAGCVDHSEVPVGREGALYHVSDNDTAPYIGELEAAEQTQNKTVCLYRNGSKTAYLVIEQGKCYRYAIMNK